MAENDNQHASQNPEKEVEAPETKSNEVTVVTVSNRRRTILISVAVLVVLLVGIITAVVLLKDDAKPASTKTSSANQATVEPVAAVVSIQAGGFSPATITVKKGQMVTWKNLDKVQHQVSADPYPTNASLPELGRGEVLEPGDEFSFYYDSVGTFSYHDNLNPYTFKGVIVVVE